MKQKTSLIDTMSDTTLIYLLHYVILFFCAIGLFACSKPNNSGSITAPTPPVDSKSFSVWCSDISYLIQSNCNSLEKWEIH